MFSRRTTRSQTTAHARTFRRRYVVPISPVEVSHADVGGISDVRNRNRPEVVGLDHVDAVMIGASEYFVAESTGVADGSAAQQLR